MDLSFPDERNRYYDWVWNEKKTFWQVSLFYTFYKVQLFAIYPQVHYIRKFNEYAQQMRWSIKFI